jgi:hypothetical protein
VYGRGYCEETDWTLRSQALGYRIVLAPSAFVYHRGQASNRDAGLLASGHTSVPAHERIVDLRYPLFREQVNGFINSEILDLLWNSARRSIMTRAAAERGYRIVLGLPNPSDDKESGPIVTLERAYGALAPVARFHGFRMELAGAAPGGDLLGSVTEFFGRDPDSVRLADHSPLSRDVAEELTRGGLDLQTELGYPVNV